MNPAQVTDEFAPLRLVLGSEAALEGWEYMGQECLPRALTILLYGNRQTRHYMNVGAHNGLCYRYEPGDRWGRGATYREMDREQAIREATGRLG